MNDIKFSSFMKYVIEKATEIAKTRGETVATVEDIFTVVVINTILVMNGDISQDKFSKEEMEALGSFVSSLTGNVTERISSVAEAVSVKKADPFNSTIQYESLIARADKSARKNGSEVITADVVINCILERPTDLIDNFMSGKDIPAATQTAPAKQTPFADVSKKTSASQDAVYIFDNKPKSDTETCAEPASVPEKKQESSEPPKTRLAKEMEILKQVRGKLLERVFGQDHVVNSVIQGLFKAAVADMTDKERRRPRATFLFAGPPGVGKTFIAEQLREHLGYEERQYKRFDMSDYSDEDSLVGLCGSDDVYKGAQQGQLTQFVAENPKCIILFDEIEKAHLKVIHQFLQILDAGRCLDQKTRRYVSFKDAIVIFTTNAGRPLYENSEQTTYADVSPKVILNALKNDIDPNTKEPFFPAAICSRFATGNVVMFNHMQANDLIRLARKNIEDHVQAVQESFGYKITIDDKLYPSVLYAEGGLADARSVSARAKSFFDNELYELLRLVEAEDSAFGSADVESISIEVELPSDKSDIRAMYNPEFGSDLLVYADEQTGAVIKSAAEAFRVHIATDYEEAVRIIKEKDIRAVLCDFCCGSSESCADYLNIEDLETDGRALFRYVTKETDVPVYVIAMPSNPLSEEEIVSLNKEGARGIIDNLSDTKALSAQLDDVGNQIHYQATLKELARANKMLRFSTGQTISQDGKSAVIRLFDLTMDVAVDAEDQDSILSKMSKPDIKFKDVRGAEDAKKELQFFIDYLKNPRKYAGSGVSAPKGILLYGPPGTGKTLLAKATAGESDVTFISQEGNDFLKGGMGEGKKAVHDLFSLARKYAPSIIFIDEIDAIAKERTGYSSPEREATLTAFLTEMDGFKTDTSKPVFVLAATNFEVEEGTAKSLDSALMRRFDRRIYIGLPSKEGREEHLREKIKKNPIFDISDDTVKNIAVRSMGQSLANLDSVLELALRTALRDGKRKVTDQILDDAFETFNSGDVRKRSEEKILRTARHEAGHTLLYWLAGDVPSYVTVVSRGDYGGYMMPGDKAEEGLSTKKDMLNRIRTSLAGRAAEIVYYGEEDGISTGPSADLRSATNVAMHMICSWGMNDDFGLSVIDVSHVDMSSLGDDVRKVVNEILTTEFRYVKDVITNNKAKIDALVDALIERSQLTGTEIVEIFESVN